MNRSNLSTQMTLWVNRFLAALIVALVFLMPAILSWYRQFRYLTDGEATGILIAFYCCFLVIEAALWNVDRLLSCILAGEVFVWHNVRRIQRIQWCCSGVSMICIPATFAYIPLIFVVLIMAFLSLTVRVVASVMEAAVRIREENDLTI